MKRVSVILFVFLAIVMFFCPVLARAGHHEYTRQEWDQRLINPKTGQMVDDPRLNHHDRKVRMIDGRQIEPDEIIAGSDARDYKLVPLENQEISTKLPKNHKSIGNQSCCDCHRVVNSSPSYGKTSEGGAIQNPTRESSTKSKGQVVNNRPVPRPATVVYHKRRGERATDLSRFLNGKADYKKVLAANGGITEKQFAKLPANFPLAIPEKLLKSKYHDPLSRIDELWKKVTEIEGKLLAMAKECQEKLAAAAEGCKRKMAAATEDINMWKGLACLAFGLAFLILVIAIVRGRRQTRVI